MTTHAPQIDLQAIEPKDRYKALVENQIAKRDKFMTSHNRCIGCALLNDFCVCTKLDALKVPDAPFDVAVIMNQKEMYRSSNTVKVIERVLNARVLVDGVENDKIDFENILNKRKNILVLFPSEDSVEWPDFTSSQKFSASTVSEEKLLILIVDGTWRQARRLNLRIPADVPRVKITPTTLSKFLCRRQAREDRVCTIEALSLLLQDMGELDASAQLDKGLFTLLEGYNTQCYGNTHRPSCMLKGLPSGKVELQQHPDALIIESDKHFIREPESRSRGE